MKFLRLNKFNAKKLRTKSAYSYLTGDYEKAQELLLQLNHNGKEEYDISIALDFCNFVVSKNPNHKKGEKYIDSKKVHGIEIRCKYCAKYTPYLDPNDGLAYLGQSNICDNCLRSYPMPSVYWDNKEGIGYMYERGSVTDKEFYLEFEKRYPDCQHSEPADFYLGRKREEWLGFDPKIGVPYLPMKGYIAISHGQETRGIFVDPRARD